MILRVVGVPVAVGVKASGLFTLADVAQAPTASITINVIAVTNAEFLNQAISIFFLDIQ